MTKIISFSDEKKKREEIKKGGKLDALQPKPKCPEGLHGLTPFKFSNRPQTAIWTVFDISKMPPEFPPHTPPLSAA